MTFLYIHGEPSLTYNPSVRGAWETTVGTSVFFGIPKMESACCEYCSKFDLM